MLEGLVITSGWDSLPISLVQIIFVYLYRNIREYSLGFLIESN